MTLGRSTATEEPPAPAGGGGAGTTALRASSSLPKWFFLGGALVLVGYLTLTPIIFLLWRMVTDQDGVLTSANLTEAYTDTGIADLTWNTVVFVVGATAVGMGTGTLLAYVHARTDIRFKKALLILSLGPLVLPGLLYTTGWILLGAPRSGIPQHGHRPALRRPTVRHLLDAGDDLGRGRQPLTAVLPADARRLLLDGFVPRGGGPLQWRSTSARSAEDHVPLDEAGLPGCDAAHDRPHSRRIRGARAAGDPRRHLGVRVPHLGGGDGLPAEHRCRLRLRLDGDARRDGPDRAPAVLRQHRRREGGTDHRRQGVRAPAARADPRVELATEAFVLFFLVATIILPTLALVYSSLLPLNMVPSKEAFEAMSLDNYRAVLDHEAVQKGTVNSLILAPLSATAVMALVSIAAWIVVRTKARGRGAFDVLTLLPITVPGIALGLSLLVVYLRVPLPIYGTLAILSSPT